MSAVLKPALRPDIAAAVAVACDRVAPTWPLDRFIAVNPYWGFRHQSIERTMALRRALAGTPGLMGRAFFREAWERGDIHRGHLVAAAAERGKTDETDALLDALTRDEPPVVRTPLFSDCVDATRDLTHALSWSDVITHQVSQFCAAHVDRAQANWRPAAGDGLYASWRAAMWDDSSVALLTGGSKPSARAMTLPADHEAMLAHGVSQLGVPPGAVADYFTALLSAVNGWAAWFAFERWEARLDGRDDVQIEELLAIRLGWECLLDDRRRGHATPHAAFAAAWEGLPALIDRHERQARTDWVWQDALERAYQQPLLQQLATPKRDDDSRADVQAVFCIDVRSEPFRRALESAAPGVRTLGFAGFFGLPIAYAPIGATTERPQLPGLLSPSLHVRDTAEQAAVGAAMGAAAQARHTRDEQWHDLQALPGSIFSFVETCGLFYLPALFTGHRTEPSNAAVRPQLVGRAAEDPELRADLAAQVLRGMSLPGNVARILLIVGHGSQSANNAHAAGLDCGACGGQAGDVNARVLAALLNDPAVRSGLRARGIHLPDDTVAVPGLHNTTTDEVTLFDTSAVPASHRSELDALERALAEAGHRTRVERAGSMGADAKAGPGPLLAWYQRRATDRAQVRPEWGLAGNASLIVAPRARTRSVHLRGRAFLHEYDCRLDASGAVLAQIMTAPMVVANWINMQYFASVVDAGHFGSGNKLLHNVVGGRVGVFEGNGGDLRIGLPVQSVHDGARWVHQPVRLTVCIEASRGAIDAVLDQHAVVRDLVKHRWLHLVRLDPEVEGAERMTDTGWRREAWPD